MAEPKKVRNRTYVGKLYDVLTQAEKATLLKAVADLSKSRPLTRHDTERNLDQILVYTIDVTAGVGGSANYKEKRLDIHTAFFRDEGRYKGERHDTLMHELAHFLSKWLFDYSGHGKAWKLCATALGIKPERCHRFIELPGTRGSRATGEGAYEKGLNQELDHLLTKHGVVMDDGILDAPKGKRFCTSGAHCDASFQDALTRPLTRKLVREITEALELGFENCIDPTCELCIDGDTQEAA